MMDLWQAEEAQELADAEVIPQWHDDLRDAQIVFLFADKLPKKGGRDVLAKIRKSTPVERCLAGADLILLIVEEEWTKHAKEWRLALLDHELCHVVAEWDDEGKVSYKIVAHDLEEFRAIVERHGEWQDDIRLMRKSMQKSLFPNLPRDLKLVAQVN